MKYGQVFCNLAYNAFCREEKELSELAQTNSTGRPLSMSIAGELPIGYLIMKQALSDPTLPWLASEYRYDRSKRKADFCFLDPERRPVASFEVKQFAPWERDVWETLRGDIKKHFDQTATSTSDCEACERYNVVVLTSDTANKEEVEKEVKKQIEPLLRNPNLYSSEPIKLCSVDSRGDTNALRWKFLQVVVFTGEYTASGDQRSATKAHAT